MTLSVHTLYCYWLKYIFVDEYHTIKCVNMLKWVLFLLQNTNFVYLVKVYQNNVTIVDFVGGVVLLPHEKFTILHI